MGLPWSRPLSPNLGAPPRARSSLDRSASPYLGELGDLLAHFHVHVGIPVHSPVGATAGISFGALASPGRVNFAVEDRSHGYNASNTQGFSLVFSLPAVCTCVRARACERVGFLRSGGTAVPPPAPPRGLCRPEVLAFRRFASPPSLLRRSLASSRALRTPAPCGETPRIRTCGSRPARRSLAGADFACNSGASATRSRRPWRGLRWPRAALLDTWVAPSSRLSSDCRWWAPQANGRIRAGFSLGQPGARSGKGPLLMFSGVDGWRGTGHLDQLAPSAPGSRASELGAEGKDCGQGVLRGKGR